MTKTALITGANRGLGYETARLLGERDITAIVSARDEEHGRAVAVQEDWLPGLPSATALEDVRRVYETNVFGVIAVTNAMLPLLRKSPAGRIVNVSSEMGSIAHSLNQDSPIWSINNLPYNSSKTALNMVTVAYAKELWNTSIKVNAPDPGWCATEINNFSGYRTAEAGAMMAVEFATLDDDGPTGTFCKYDGPLPW
jgi:NAD(P)-dependent dehydrogenase (short-subunit alcohol dehydrogenase family)